MIKNTVIYTILCYALDRLVASITHNPHLLTNVFYFGIGLGVASFVLYMAVLILGMIILIGCVDSGDVKLKVKSNTASKSITEKH